MNLEALFNKAFAFHQNNNLAEAERLYLQIQAVQPANFNICQLLGIVRYQQGRKIEAIEMLEAALKISPNDAKALSNYGNVLIDLGRFEEALASLNRALMIKPALIEALNNRGGALRGLKRFGEALASFDKALAIRPDYVEALNNRGGVLLTLKRLEGALVSFDKVLAIKPDYIEALNDRGLTLHGLNRLELALASFDKALAIKSDYLEALNNRGSVLQALNRFEEALASYDKALAIKPDYIEALNDRGLSLMGLKRFEEALESFDKALSIRADYGEALNNRGGALQQLDRFEEALASFDKAPAIRPDFAQAWVNRANCALLMGHFEKGWQSYEWRRKLPNSFKPLAYRQPEWSGKETIRGKTLLLYAEQGFGDTIQFCRYAALAQALGAEVVLSVQSGLVQLLKNSIPAVEVISSEALPPSFDYHAPLMSMPLAFQTNSNSIPAAVPYLRAGPEVVTRWRGRIGKEGFRIGISWQGKKSSEADMGRSFPLHHFKRLSKFPNVRLISLQKNDGIEQLVELPTGMKVETLGDDFDEGSFMDTAAVMENIDLIITSDTAVAHLAGALGRPTWVALQYVPDWRWQLRRADSPWYPTMRLFRQPSQCDWPGVFSEIETQLVNLIGRK
jgi:tetratricopeptide (TPR) repeat protein